MTIRYYTVVYRVDGDKAAHNAWWQAIRPLFMSDSEPVSIIAISARDEVERLDHVERIVKGRGPNAEKVEAIEAVLVQP